MTALRHRAREEIGLEKNALRVVLEGADDDMLSLLPEAEAAALSTYSHDLRVAIMRLVEQTAEAVERGEGMERKLYATEVVPTLPPLLRPAAFAEWEGKGARGVIVSHLLRAAGSGPRLAAVLEAHHLPRWAAYWQAPEEEPS